MTTTTSTVATPATATSNLYDNDYKHSGYSSHCYIKLTRHRLQAQWLLQPLLHQTYMTTTTGIVATPATATSNLHDNDYKHSDYSSHCYIKLTRQRLQAQWLLQPLLHQTYMTTTTGIVATPATATSNLHDTDYKHSGYSSHCYIKLTRHRLQAQWLLQPLLRQTYMTLTTSTVATPATATLNLHDNDYRHSGYSSHCYVKLT